MLKQWLVCLGLLSVHSLGFAASCQEIVNSINSDITKYADTLGAQAFAWRDVGWLQKNLGLTRGKATDAHLLEYSWQCPNQTGFLKVQTDDKGVVQSVSGQYASDAGTGLFSATLPQITVSVPQTINTTPAANEPTSLPPTNAPQATTPPPSDTPPTTVDNPAPVNTPPVSVTTTPSVNTPPPSPPGTMTVTPSTSAEAPVNLPPPNNTATATVNIPPPPIEEPITDARILAALNSYNQQFNTKVLTLNQFKMDNAARIQNFYANLKQCNPGTYQYAVFSFPLVFYIPTSVITGNINGRCVVETTYTVPQMGTLVSACEYSPATLLLFTDKEIKNMTEGNEIYDSTKPSALQKARAVECKEKK